MKLKVRKFWKLVPKFVEVTGEKLVEGDFACLQSHPIKITYKIITIQIQQYLQRSKDQMIKEANKHEKRKINYFITKEKRKYLRKVNV